MPTIDKRIYVQAFEDPDVSNIYRFSVACRMFRDDTPIPHQENHMYVYTHSELDGQEIINLDGIYNDNLEKDRIFKGPLSTTGQLDANRMLYDWIQEKAHQLSRELRLPIDYSVKFRKLEESLESGNFP
jgi:hypothetical protein